ncbi:hypothetical protein PV325_011909 [Microctonus aethiopoides]|nr:hypothetical protein PV325_011909 [Microctonus aethiopoides]
MTPSARVTFNNRTSHVHYIDDSDDDADDDDDNDNDNDEAEVLQQQGRRKGGTCRFSRFKVELIGQRVPQDV